MPITLNCPKCRKPFRVRDESVGLRVKCPNCQAILQVPSAISPASITGSDIPPSQPGVVPPPPVVPPAPKPIAQPVQTSELGDAPKGRNEESDFVDELPAPSPTSGPPSLPPHPINPSRSRKTSIEPIPERSRIARTEPPAKQTTRDKERSRRENEAEREDIAEEAAGWKKVRFGLRLVQIGMLFALLPAIGVFVNIAVLQRPDLEINLKQQGFLGTGKNLGAEVEMLYLYAPPILAYLFVLLGRLLCMGVPDSARTRGLAGGTFFLTLIAFGAFLAFAAYKLLPVFTDERLPKQVEFISWTVLIFIGLVAEGWFYTFLGQIGWPIGYSKIQREMALSILLLVVVIAGVIIGNEFYPLLDPEKHAPKIERGIVVSGDEAEYYNYRLINAGVLLVIALLFTFREIAVAGMARKSIRRWLKDNAVPANQISE